MVIYYISKDGVKELPVDKETKSTYRLKGYKGTPHRMMINKTELNKYAGSEMFGYVYSLDKNKGIEIYNEYKTSLFDRVKAQIIRLCPKCGFEMVSIGGPFYECEDCEIERMN